MRRAEVVVDDGGPVRPPGVTVGGPAPFWLS